MARSNESARQGAGGFDGGIAGFGLSDLLQLNAQNRFSGCFRVQHGDRSGLIFYRDGEIVHAEQGARVGEEALCELLDWPGGQFSVEPNVVTARRTIHKSCEHLLLDAVRVLDERRASRGHAAPAPTPAPVAKPASPGSAVDAVRQVPGVATAVLMTREGHRLGDEGYDEEVLAGQSVYLSAFALELGALFEAGDIRSAAVQGSGQHLLLLAAKAHYLGVFVRPEYEVGAVDAAIRGALAKRR
jgi:Domain of unknown function (DUF4388)